MARRSQAPRARSWARGRASGSALRELIAAGIELSAVELEALECLDVTAIHRFAQALDPRLQKAMLVGNKGGPSRDGGSGRES